MIPGPYFGITEEQYNLSKDKSLKELVDTLPKDTLKEIIKLYIDGVDCRIEIFIRFPKVTVTNEYDKSIDITELYAKVTISPLGKLLGYFNLQRAEYTLAQWIAGYSHSHMPGRALGWQDPCLGRGPINQTCGRLWREFDPDVWGLFCYELSKYGTVESIEGGPYRRLESVGKNTNIERNCIFTSNSWYNGILYNRIIVEKFFIYYLKNYKLEIKYVNGSYLIGEHSVDFWVKVSKAFIKWYNEEYSSYRLNYPLVKLLREGLIGKYIVDGNIVYKPISTDELDHINNIQGSDLFVFKGEMVKLNIINNFNNIENNISYLLNPTIVSKYLTIILNIINYYGEETKGEATEKCYFI